MAHSKEAHGKHNAMAQFNEGHWKKNEGDLGTSNLKYTQGEMANPEHLKKSNDALASYVKKNKMSH
jgi:hypothetical protein